MTEELNEAGVWAWREWAENLGTELAEAGTEESGDDAYYTAWLAALEKMLDRKGVVPEAERSTREAAWDSAAKATPHGQPIELAAKERG